MTAAQFINSAVTALVDAIGTDYAATMMSATGGAAAALAVLVTFAKVVRLVADDAPTASVHAAVRVLLEELEAIRRADRKAAA